MKIELELSNYTTKTDLKNAAGVDSSDFAKRIKLANLKFVADKSEDSNGVWNHNHLVCKRTLNHLDIDKLDIDKYRLDIDKLKNVATNLSNLRSK